MWSRSSHLAHTHIPGAEYALPTVTRRDPSCVTCPEDACSLVKAFAKHGPQLLTGLDRLLSLRKAREPGVFGSKRVHTHCLQGSPRVLVSFENHEHRKASRMAVRRPTKAAASWAAGTTSVPGGSGTSGRSET